MPTQIKNCPGCKPHNFQDQVYGPNQRVMNFTAKNSGWRCTVCGKDLMQGKK